MDVAYVNAVSKSRLHNPRFPGQPPGNYMMQSGQQFVQGAMGVYPMMQQGMMMQQHPMMQQQQQMFPMQQSIGMRANLPPPSYNQALVDSSRFRNPQPSRPRQPLSPASQRKLEQQQRLRNFGKGTPVNADKFIESMFGKTEKPAPKPPIQTVQPSAQPVTNKIQTVQQEADDDGFGDFLGGPSVSNSEEMTNNSSNVPQTCVANAVPASQSSSLKSSGTNQPQKEKKDLMAMMMECSDLNAPNKAKTFHKPTLKDLHSNQPVIHSTHTFQESKQAHRWKPEEDLSGVFLVQEPIPPTAPATQTVLASGDTPSTHSSPPPKFTLPSWCKDDAKVPIVYRQVYEACLVDGEILTERLYPILLMSGLAKENLGQIWSLANKTHPGRLTKPELYLALALIAFAQNNYTSLSMEVLHKCPQPPVPFLGQQSETPPPGPVVSGPALSAGSSCQVTSNTQEIPENQQPPLQENFHPVVGNMQPTSSAVNTIGPSLSSTVNQSRFADDDFEDFQEAPPQVLSTHSPQKAAIKKKSEEPEYLYSVPTPDDSKFSQDQKHSNVRVFFGSDDSSASLHRVIDSQDESIGNSMDGDFDDYKSADSKPSDSSQFTSSEQSENEDFKVFESYLDDFNRKKSDLEAKQESPLHKPIPKFTGSQVSQLPNTAKLTSIPAIKSLWPKSDDKETGFSVTKSTAKGLVPQLGISPPQSSDSDFADFQQAPVIDSSTIRTESFKPSGSETCLIGDEDKYAAFRAFDSVPVSSVFDSKNNDTQIDESKRDVVAIETDDDSWADFQAVSGESKEQVQTKDAILGLYDNSKENMEGVLTEVKCEKKSDWSELGDNIQSDASDWSNFASSKINVENKEDDWSNFSKSENNNTKMNNEEESIQEWADFDGNTEIEKDDIQPNLVQIKKQNLNTNEILGLFKVREQIPSNLKLESNVLPKPSETKPPIDNNLNPEPSSPVHKAFKPKASVGQDYDEDPFMIPPPIDDCHDDYEDDYGEFSRGYDLDDVIHAPKQNENQQKNLYSFYGMDLGPGKSSVKKDNTLTVSDSDMKKSDSNTDFCDTDSVSSKEGINWPGSSAVKTEDSQSVSSLDLPFNKSRLQNVKDADSQSVSSNEFGNFETHLKPPSNPESKSVDSLDLKAIDITGSLEQSDGDQSARSSKEGSPEGTVPDPEPAVHLNTSLPGNFPVLGDRYSEILEDVPGSDKHAYEWQRCLENCYKMIKDANNIFNSISSSSVCNEVIKSEQGSEYVEGVVEIYRVVCRVTTGMKSTALSTDKLSQLLKEIDLAWNNLTAFLVGGNMMPDDNALNFRNCLLKSDDSVSQYRACGVCLLDVDVPCQSFNRDEECGKLTYGGRQYHATCANFWVNCVDSMLPALKLPELL